jgi:hypothetical protein
LTLLRKNVLDVEHRLPSSNKIGVEAAFVRSFGALFVNCELDHISDVWKDPHGVLEADVHAQVPCHTSHPFHVFNRIILSNSNVRVSIVAWKHLKIPLVIGSEQAWNISLPAAMFMNCNWRGVHT